MYRYLIIIPSFIIGYSMHIGILPFINFEEATSCLLWPLKRVNIDRWHQTNTNRTANYAINQIEFDNVYASIYPLVVNTTEAARKSDIAPLASILRSERAVNRATTRLSEVLTAASRVRDERLKRALVQLAERNRYTYSLGLCDNV